MGQEIRKNGFMPFPLSLKRTESVLTGIQIRRTNSIFRYATLKDGERTRFDRRNVHHFLKIFWWLFNVRKSVLKAHMWNDQKKMKKKLYLRQDPHSIYCWSNALIFCRNYWEFVVVVIVYCLLLKWSPTDRIL